MKRLAALANGNPGAAGGGRADSRSAISVDAIRAQLEKIVTSEAFSHSERLCRFLRFTVEEAVQGRGAGLKEYQIGVEVFDKKGAYDPRIDPIVRVEASRLRGKLEEYYRGTGRNDPVLITLKKGSYVPSFGQARPSRSPWVTRWLQLPPERALVALLLSLVLTVLALSGGIYLFVQNRSLQTHAHKTGLEAVDRDLALLWGRFLAPGAKNLVIFGSPVFFASEREGLFLRWQGLHDIPDHAGDPHFQRMQQQFGPLSGPRYDYALTGDAIALQQLTAFFGRAGASLAAVPANLANWEALQDTNVIFLGAPRMLPLLARLPVQQDFAWDANYNVVNRKPQAGEQPNYATSSHYDEISYAIVARFAGLRGDRQIMLLTAHSAPGISAAVDQLTQADRVRGLVQRLGLSETAPPKDYQVLIRVLVDKGARVKSEYVTHHLSSPAPQKP